MKALTAAAFGFILSVQATFAAEPVFPPASRIGLVPPPDMTLSKRFSGFENDERAAVITFSELPAGAFDQLSSGLTKDVLKKQGLELTTKEDVKLGSSSGILVSGTMVKPVMGRKWLLLLKDEALTGLVVAQVNGGSEGYSDEQIREALKSVALRHDVSLEEQVSALPFRIVENAGFRPVRVIAGSSVLFTDGPKDTIKAVEQPMMIVGSSLQPVPPSSEQRKQFAQAALYANQVLRNIRIERSDSFRLRGQDWHEIVARAVEAESGQPIVVMQSIRFDGDRYVRMVGLTREEERDRNLPRFRAIADGLEMRF